MNEIEERRVPKGSLLQHFADSQGTYTDAFVAQVKSAPSLHDYIEAMFDSPVFRIERLILAVTVFKPAFRKDVSALAAGEGDQLAGWKLMQRTDQELLLAVENGRVRTWLMIEPISDEVSRVWFGSAVVPKQSKNGAAEGLGIAYRSMLAVHKYYSRVLLRSAIRRLSAHTDL